jgi:serine protease Do
MKLSFGIGMACLAVGLFAPALWSQTARGRNGQVTVQVGGASYLGIGVADITAERAKALNLKEERGAEVTNVAQDSPASKAGIKEGDVVLEYDGTTVQGIEQLTRLVRETPVGRQVKISVWRNGAAQTLTATIEARKGTVVRSNGRDIVVPFGNGMPGMPFPMPQIEIPRFQMTWQNPVLGIEGESLTSEEQLADFFGVKDGVLVKLVRKNSAAEKAGIKAGDVIVKLDDSTVTTPQEITRALRALGSKKTFTVTVVRNKKETPLTVTLEERGGAIRADDPALQC